MSALIGELSVSHSRRGGQGFWIPISTLNYNPQQTEERRCEIEGTKPQIYGEVPEGVELIQEVKSGVQSHISIYSISYIAKDMKTSKYIRG